VSLGMKVIPALAAGNCVVTKPSEFTPFAPDLYGRLLRQAGVPAGACGVLAGQGCVVPTRLIVHADIYDEMLELVVAAAASYEVGDPFDPEVKVGPLINAAAVERVCGMLDRARRDNAGRIALGGGRARGDLADKNFVEPTVIVDADPRHEIAQTEIFGPVLLVQVLDRGRGGRAGQQHALRARANIQSTNLTRVHRLAERLKAGGVYVNGARQNLPHTPFGGLGISGYGKEGGRAGIDEFLRYKTVSIVEPR
jgi:aldehyde dehydrogenase (NAD+)